MRSLDMGCANNIGIMGIQLELLNPMEDQDVMFLVTQLASFALIGCKLYQR